MHSEYQSTSRRVQVVAKKRKKKEEVEVREGVEEEYYQIIIRTK